MGVGTGGGPSGGGFGGGTGVGGGWGFGGSTYGGMGGIADSMAGQGSAFGLGYDATGLGNFGSHAAGTDAMGGSVYGGLVGKDRAAYEDALTNAAAQSLSAQISAALADARGMTGGTLDAALGKIGAAYGGDVSAAKGLGVSQGDIDAMMDKSIFGGTELSLGGLISSMFGEEKEKGFSNPAKARDALAKSGLAETDEQGNITGPNNAAVIGKVAFGRNVRDALASPVTKSGLATLGAFGFDQAPSQSTGVIGGLTNALGAPTAMGIARSGLESIGRADSIYGGFANAGLGEMAAAPTDSYSGPGRSSQSGREGDEIENRGNVWPNQTSEPQKQAPLYRPTYSTPFNRLNNFLGHPWVNTGYSLLFPSLSNGAAPWDLWRRKNENI